MARRLALAFLAPLLAAPPLVQAQTNPASGQITVVESADSNENPPIINIAECKGLTADTLTYFFNIPNFAGAGTYDLFIADTQSSSTACPATAATSASVAVKSSHIISGEPIPSSQSVVDGSTVNARLNNGTLAINCDTSTTTTLYLCINTSINGTPTQNVATGSITLDLGLPATPASVRVLAGDTQLHVSWTAGNGGASATTGYRVRWVPTAGGTSRSHDLDGIGTLSYDIPNLSNGTEYQVQVAGLSVGKNESTASTAVPGTPVPIDDFWRLYQNDGGRERGGCDAGAGGLVALLVFLPLVARRRGRRP